MWVLVGFGGRILIDSNHSLPFFYIIKSAHITTTQYTHSHTARKWHGSRARTNFDEQGNRTESRLQFRNSPTARAQYVLATAAESEQAK